MSDMMVTSTILPAAVALLFALEYAGLCISRLAQRMHRGARRPTRKQVSSP